MSYDPDDNPFDRLELDPRMSPQELTEELRRRAERALPERRQQIQTLWRELTLHDADRVRWALLAHPRSSGLSAELETIRAKVPPFLQRLQLDALTLRAGDALTMPDEDAAAAPPLMPRSLLDQVEAWLPDDTRHHED